jgi:phage terminase small subunit
MEENQNYNLTLPDYKKFGLTTKQAQFATYVLYGYNNSDACRKAGYGGKNHVVMGYELSQNPKIIEYLNHLRSVTIYTYGISKNSLIEELLRIKQKAMEKENFNAALSAVKTIANLVGYDNGKNPEKPSSKSDDEGNNSTANNFNVVFLTGQEKKKDSNIIIESPQVIEQAKIVDELNSQTQEIIKKKIKEDGEGD